jgi:peptide/bleomycin uptake transporter
MYVSFFPQPKLFFLSAIAWTAIVMAFWYFGLPPSVPPARAGPTWFGWVEPAKPIIGVQVFWSLPFLWFYAYWAAATAIFAGFWMLYRPHPWARWSIWGSSLIMFVTYFNVQVNVAVNNWRGPFFDSVQAALARSRPVTMEEYLGFLAVFAGIGFLATAVLVANSFFVSHYVFRWRTAMNNFYTANWQQLRRVEGASQRVQDDTMQFSSTVESLGVRLIGSVMTLIAFLPILHGLEGLISELPIVGAIPYPLVTAAFFWAAFGTGLLAVVGVRLPGLTFRNQMVEAALRKELVYGEDAVVRASPPTLIELFGAVRRNYFRLYWNYAYFNVVRNLYAQADAIFVYIILGPSVVAGRLTLGPFQQILGAFGSVSASFDYLVNSWTTIINLISIYKRLRAFEAILYHTPMDKIESESPPDETPHPELLGDTIKQKELA